jgi:hypothetical protein
MAWEADTRAEIAEHFDRLVVPRIGGMMLAKLSRKPADAADYDEHRREQYRESKAAAAARDPEAVRAAWRAAAAKRRADDEARASKAAAKRARRHALAAAAGREPGKRGRPRHA